MGLCSQSVSQSGCSQGRAFIREILSSFCGHDELPPFVGVAELLQNVWRAILIGGQIWNNGGQVRTWKTLYLK